MYSLLDDGLTGAILPEIGPHPRETVPPAPPVARGPG